MLFDFGCWLQLKKVPTGMPPSSLNRLHFGNTGDVFADAFICAFIALTEAIAIGTTFATKNGYHINGNQEVRIPPCCPFCWPLLTLRILSPPVSCLC
jgi:hypothetical protein